MLRRDAAGTSGEMTYRGYHIETATVAIRLRFILKDVYDIVLVTADPCLPWEHTFHYFHDYIKNIRKRCAFQAVSPAH